MAMDVYAPCPCGSGKKLKFCCQNLAEDMERISRLIDNHQPRQALAQLEALEKKHPEHPWVATTQAIVLLETGETQAARDRLKTYTERHPDHDMAAVLYAVAAYQHDGLESSRPIICRALQKGAKRQGAMVAGLTRAMAAHFGQQEQFLAVREHLALTLRFSPEEQRQEVFLQLLDFDNDSSIPYPLRSAHPLPTITGDDAVQAEVRKAHKYALVGCWNTSAEIFEQLAAAQPTAAEPWHAAGLCHAWFGDDVRAGQALHRAAELYADRSIAVECEVLAQLIDWNTTGDRMSRVVSTGNPTSLGRLLTLLDGLPQLQRVELPPPNPNREPQPTALYQWLSKPVADVPAVDQLTVDNVPRSLADISIFDIAPGEKTEPVMLVQGMDTPDYQAALAGLKQACGDLVALSTDTQAQEEQPRHIAVLSEILAFPPKVPFALRRRILCEHWRRLVHERWLETPQPALGGRSPKQAAGDPAAAVKLLAAIYTLEAVGLRWGYDVDIPALLAELRLEALPPYPVTPETSINNLSPLQWLRLPLEQLSDDQLTSVVKRAQLIHHDGVMYDALREVLKHPECMRHLEPARIYHALTDLCRMHQRRDEAFQWMAEARKADLAEGQEFEQVWRWDLRELLMRLEDPGDPALMPLAQKFVTYYGPKLPQMQPYVEQMFDLVGLPSPWLTKTILTPDSAGGMTGGGLWTPGAAEPATPGGGKLWIPS